MKIIRIFLTTVASPFILVAFLGGVIASIIMGGGLYMTTMQKLHKLIHG